MYLRSREENKRICKICENEGFVDCYNPIFHCSKCNWIEDEWQEKNPKSKDGRNAKTFNQTKKIYENHKKKYGVLVDKIIKVKMKNGEIKEGECRGYSYKAILMPNNGTWIDIEDIKSIKVVKDIITIKCPIFVDNDDKDVDKETCDLICICVNNPGKNTKTEEWIKKYNKDYVSACRQCKYNFKVLFQDYKGHEKR